MKRLRIVLCCILAANVLVAPVASAKGILPCMVYRHGLTNEQIDDLLARHPNGTLQITAQDWRAMRYQLHRFDCMTNYVELIGGTNDCARVLLELHDAAETWKTRHAAVSNLYARAERGLSVATERAQEYAAAYTSATNSLAVATADYLSASNRAARAEARHDAIVAWAKSQRDKALLATTKAIWQSFIDRLEGDD